MQHAFGIRRQRAGILLHARFQVHVSPHTRATLGASQPNLQTQSVEVDIDELNKTLEMAVDRKEAYEVDIESLENSLAEEEALITRCEELLAEIDAI